MCRLFGMSGGPQAVRATFWLLQAPDSLSQQSRREPDGAGIGCFDADGRPVVDKQPLAAYEDRDFAREARELESRTFVAHVRYASNGDLTVANTHPFEQDGRLFAHNGVIGDLHRLDDGAGGRPPPRRRRDRLRALLRPHHPRDPPLRRRRRRHRGGGRLGGRRPPGAVDQLRARSPRRTCGRCAIPTPTTCWCSSARPGGGSLEHASAHRIRVSSRSAGRSPRGGDRHASAWTTTPAGGRWPPASSSTSTAI